MSSDAPPAFEANVISLVSVEHSNILGVSLYSDCAEITRLFDTSVQTGLNKIKIIGLPNALEKKTVRVEARGEATILDVSVSTGSPPSSLKDLLREQDLKQKALERCETSRQSLKTYFSRLSDHQVNVSAVGTALEIYDLAAQLLDSKLSTIEAELFLINHEIHEKRSETGVAAQSNCNEDKLRTGLDIDLFAGGSGRVQIVITYAVFLAGWKAGYDVRVKRDTKELPINMLYKAIVKQSTGEDWRDVPLTLETATPTFGTEVPELRAWDISIHRVYVEKSNNFSSGGSTRLVRSIGPIDGGNGSVFSKGRETVGTEAAFTPVLRVPGLVTVPSDNAAHTLTITQLDLDAAMSWIAVPKEHARVHLQARIHNSSQYSLLAGNASVYVDGSFISKTELPPVSPQENFDVALGLDHTIRITYHPRRKRTSLSGFYNKTSNHLLTQDITIHNTKHTHVSNLRVVDHIPVSTDSEISIKLTTPALTLAIVPNASGSKTAKASSAPTAPPPVKVEKGVVAQWEGADNLEGDLAALGRNGRFYWLCEVPPQKTIKLTLQWEVTAPAGSNVLRL